MMEKSAGGFAGRMLTVRWDEQADASNLKA